MASLKFLLPEFESHHALPITTQPPPRVDFLDYADVVVLALALGLAAYFALKARSRRKIALLTVFSLLYFGFWRGGCVCPIGAIQNVVLGLFSTAYVVPLSILGFLLLPLVFALFFGRVFCGAVCPLGAVQDLVLIRPVRLPLWLQRALGLIAYAYLGAAVLFTATGSAFVICRHDPFITLFRLAPLGTWVRSLAGSPPPGGVCGAAGRADLMIVAGAAIIVSMFIGRFYCRIFCPLGALFRIVSPLAKWHLTITPDTCVQCRLCEDACPFGAIRMPSAPGPARNRGREKKRLILLMILLPLIAAAGALLGWMARGQLARMDYTVRLAEQVRMEETGAAAGTTNASDAFRAAGGEKSDLYREALSKQREFALGGTLLGGFIGLVIGFSLIKFSVYRTVSDYEPDRSQCVSCGRCIEYCPVEHKRRGLPATGVTP